MWRMLKMTLTAILMLLPFVAVAQDIASAQSLSRRFSDAEKGSCVTFSYSFTMRGNAPVHGEGTAVLQGNMFIVKGNGMEIWCDGKSRWTADRTAKELIVEDVDGQASIEANPALLISSLESSFRPTETAAESVSGKKLHKVSYVPSVKGTGVTALDVWFTDAAKPLIVKLSASLEKKGVVDLKISSMSFGPLRAASSFVFSGSDSSWVITDLR